jgi:hypothetical protein
VNLLHKNNKKNLLKLLSSSESTVLAESILKVGPPRFVEYTINKTIEKQV